MFLQLKGLKKIYEEEKGLKNLDLEIEEGSFVTLLGPSGCGKTTTLNLLGGFIQPDSGHILLEGEDITGLPPELCAFSSSECAGQRLLRTPVFQRDEEEGGGSHCNGGVKDCGAFRL